MQLIGLGSMIETKMYIATNEGGKPLFDKHEQYKFAIYAYIMQEVNSIKRCSHCTSPNGSWVARLLCHRCNRGKQRGEAGG